MKRLPSYTSVLLAALCSTAASAQNATVPGEVTAPYPTITNLSVEWRIEGDANLNGVVTVRYRRAGDQEWREAMPLRRVPAGTSLGATPTFRWDNKHSGSIFDLRPDTRYEIHLKLDDPDGGSAERTIEARTRPVPRAPANASVRLVSPGQLGDAQPGEILLLAAGDYGDFTVPRSGEAGRPIVFRSLDGGAVFRSISLQNRRYIHLDGLTINNPGGTGVNMRGAEDCVVRRCRITADFGIRASSAPGAKNSYIADNIINGPSSWRDEAMGAQGDNLGEGVQLTGPGNVIAFNRVTGFRDNISLMEGSSVSEQFSIDIYNNDIYSGTDDGVEADYCFNNCRIMRNRITNSFVGLSSQPGLGGPTYFIRNVMYNLTYAPFKLHNYSMGDVVMHNTTVKIGSGMACFTGQAFDFAYFRNNLSIGGPPGPPLNVPGGYGPGRGYAAEIEAHGPNSSFDYDAVGTLQTPFVALIGRRDFFTVERNGIRVEMSDVFPHVDYPLPPVPEREPADLRPRNGSKAVDAALRIPNINDDFLGNGPDIGAYEAGQPLPIYGPRPEGMDEETVLIEPSPGVARLPAGRTPRAPLAPGRPVGR